MRCFIAIELSEDVKSGLAVLQQDLKECGADIRWVKPDNIHLTLKFLGDVDETNVRSIVEQVVGACANYSFFDLEISGIGVFPNMKSPRVLWAGVQGVDMFEGLYRDIDAGMASLGFQKEKRKFSPHLTLGRFRSMKGKSAAADKIELHENDRFGSIKVKAVSLIKSELNPAGAKYTRVAEVTIGKGLE